MRNSNLALNDHKHSYNMVMLSIASFLKVKTIIHIHNFLRVKTISRDFHAHDYVF